jgi:hypothetical protein
LDPGPELGAFATGVEPGKSVFDSARQLDPGHGSVGVLVEAAAESDREQLEVGGHGVEREVAGSAALVRVERAAHEGVLAHVLGLADGAVDDGDLAQVAGDVEDLRLGWLAPVPLLKKPLQSEKQLESSGEATGRVKSWLPLAAGLVSKSERLQVVAAGLVQFCP